MLNRNFKTVMLGWFMSSQATGYSNPKFKTLQIFNVNRQGDYYPVASESSSTIEDMTKGMINALNALTTNNTIARQAANRLFMAVGTGTTEATEKDYTLESENSDITCETITQTYTSSYKRQITATFSNPTNQDITLKEVGVFCEMYYNVSLYLSTIMLARENIDVTIPAGESKAITMEIG